jgi:hypothetical protein
MYRVRTFSYHYAIACLAIGDTSGISTGCQVALVVTLVRGSTRDPPHEQLLMDVWWVLVRRALRVVSMRRQVKEGWGGYLPHTGLQVLSPPIVVCSLLHPSCFFLRSSPRAWGAHSQGDSSSFFPKKSINLMVSMIE